jgi:hypothetical protein
LVAAGFIGLSAGGRIIPGFICTSDRFAPTQTCKATAKLLRLLSLFLTSALALSQLEP